MPRDIPRMMFMQYLLRFKQQEHVVSWGGKKLNALQINATAWIRQRQFAV